MGTTLTGTTPQDTYDSLIKVTDNGPLSGTAKYLSDGLGNDSALALSTARVGVGTASPDHPLQVNGNVLFKNSLNNALAFFAKEADDSGTLYLYNNGTLKNVIASNGNSYFNGGNVGIGTSSPECKLHVAGTASGSDVTLYVDNAAASALNNSTRLKFSSDAGSSVSGGGAELNCSVVDAGNGAVDLLVKSWTGGAYTEKARFLAAGGLTFNGDTAAANALDDYEEGTFTPTVEGNSSAGTATYSVQIGKYTKIGNQISILIDLAWSGGTGTGNLRIVGLPFTNVAFNTAGTIGFIDSIALTASNYATTYVGPSSTRLDFVQSPTGGGSVTDVPYDAAGRLIVSATYFNV